MTGCHRTGNETFQVLRRMAYWDGLGTDCDRFYKACLVCIKFRSHPTQGPYRSMLADPGSAVVLPYQDVIIDVQGPFTKAEGGEQYVISYHCTRLKVPLLEPMKTLQSGHFSKALIKCILRSRVIPDVVRSDRGPEMVKKINANKSNTVQPKESYTMAAGTETAKETVCCEALVSRKEMRAS